MSIGKMNIIPEKSITKLYFHNAKIHKLNRSCIKNSSFLTVFNFVKLL